jgi:cullin-4
MIRSIFLYLDRTYAVPNTSVLSIWDMGLELFGCHIIAPDRVQNRVVKGTLSLITKERCGESVDRLLLKNLLTMLVDLQMYSEAFETDFLLETEMVYRTESLHMMRDTEFTLPDYLAHVDRRLQQEMELLNNYLHKSTRKPLILCVEKQLIGEHLEEILDKGYESLLEAMRVPELSLLYGFFARFKDGLPLMTKAFSNYIKKSGVAIVSDSEREKTLVQELLELKAKVDGIIENAFKNSPLFQGVVREGFEAVVNRRQNEKH